MAIGPDVHYRHPSTIPIYPCGRITISTQNAAVDLLRAIRGTGFRVILRENTPRTVRSWSELPTSRPFKALLGDVEMRTIHKLDEVDEGLFPLWLTKDNIDYEIKNREALNSYCTPYIINIEGHTYTIKDQKITNKIGFPIKVWDGRQAVLLVRQTGEYGLEIPLSEHKSGECCITAKFRGDRVWLVIHQPGKTRWIDTGDVSELQKKSGLISMAVSQLPILAQKTMHLLAPVGRGSKTNC